MFRDMKLKGTYNLGCKFDLSCFQKHMCTMRLEGTDAQMCDTSAWILHVFTHLSKGHSRKAPEAHAPPFVPLIDWCRQGADVQ